MVFDSLLKYLGGFQEREKQELERQLEEGMKEEERYRKIVEQMLTTDVECKYKHPFKKVLDSHECKCPIP